MKMQHDELNDGQSTAEKEQGGRIDGGHKKFKPKPYRIREVDVANETFTMMDFYQNHIAKALPVLMRNESAQWPLKKKLDEVKNDKILYRQYLLSIFNSKTKFDKIFAKETNK